MNDLISDITWMERSPDIQSLLLCNDSIQIDSMDSGLEADVYRINTIDVSFVLKVWNKQSRPDISTQYHVLEAMYQRGISVSKPYGWGVDSDQNPVLLTSFDGVSINKLNKLKVTTIANILCDIHTIPTDKIDTYILPQYNFVDYFFPAIDSHLDIKELLIELVATVNLAQTHLIHGDYHLGNIVESEEMYTVIDWTNVQLGDPRYDIAWSIILLWIYAGERNSSIYRAVFLSHNNYTLEETEKFEAIACLRFILLNRIAKVPKRENTISTVKTILSKNKYLNERLL